MGNRQKSQRKMFYEHQQKKLYSTIREASKQQVKPPPQVSTAGRSVTSLSEISQQQQVQSNLHSGGSKSQQQQQVQSQTNIDQDKRSSAEEDVLSDFSTILEVDCLNNNLSDIKASILARIEEGSICVINPSDFDETGERTRNSGGIQATTTAGKQVNRKKHLQNKFNNLLNSAQSFEDIRELWRSQCSTHHFAEYERVVLSLLESYNKQMRVEQISKKRWEQFCADLEEHSFLPKSKKLQQQQNNSKNLFQTSLNTPQFDLKNAFSKHQQQPPGASAFNIFPTNLTSSEADSQSREDEALIREEIRRFRQFLIASNETFQLFRVVSSQLHIAFTRIYGENELPERLAHVSPWTLEKYIEIDLLYFVSVFEMLLSKMSEFYSIHSIVQSFGNSSEVLGIAYGGNNSLPKSMSIKPSSSIELRQSFLHAMQGETTTLPIVNMIFVLMRKTFDRIRSILAPHAPSKKMFNYLSKRSSKEFIAKESQQLLHVDVPYSQSIAVLQRLQQSFRKNPVKAVKALKTILKPIIIREIEDAALVLKAKKALQLSTLMHSTAITVATTTGSTPMYSLKTNSVKTKMEQGVESGLAEIKEIQHAESMNIASDNINNNNNKNCLEENSDGGDSLKVKRYFSADESHRNVSNVESDDRGQLVGQGAEEMLPIYAYVIVQAEAKMSETMYVDLKIFNMIFGEIQEKVPSFTEHIFNATNLLQAYANLTDIYEEKLLLREKKSATQSN